MLKYTDLPNYSIELGIKNGGISLVLVPTSTFLVLWHPY